MYLPKLDFMCKAVLHPPRKLGGRAFADDRVVTFHVVFAYERMADDFSFDKSLRQCFSLSCRVRLVSTQLEDLRDIVRMAHVLSNDGVHARRVSKSFETR